MEEYKKQPRILLVANVAKEHVIKFHIPTIKMMREQGWNIDVACSGNEEISYCNHQFVLSYKRSPFNFSIFKGIRELTKIINEGEYDIIYCHTPVGGVAARIASVRARRKGTKVIYFAHGYHFFKGAPKLNWLIYYPIEKAMSLVTDSIILINREDYQLTIKKFKKCKAYQLNGIGVDTSRFEITDGKGVRCEYRKQMDIPQDANVLVYLAELLPNKNQMFLMRVLKRVLESEPNTFLILAGFDHSDGEFEKYAEKIGISKNVRFLGWREDVANLYAMSDICTASSIREGFGLNLVEAMACGIPVIATKNRGHETIIKNGENGFLVDLGDENTFEKCVIQLIRDRRLREKFIARGKNEQKKYESHTILNDIQRIMEEHLS